MPGVRNQQFYFVPGVRNGKLYLAVKGLMENMVDDSDDDGDDFSGFVLGLTTSHAALVGS